ncbi:MAG: hypothetical protein H7X79_14255 [Sporomusaceae bacterium]|nr:hypothetical protein [Sporomusaceae bacterium]
MMNYRQRLTYRGVESLSNRSSARVKSLGITDKSLDKVNKDQNISPVGSAKDTYGYIGFTSQES